MTTAKLITYRKFSDSWDWKTKVACTGIKVWTRSKYFHTELWMDGLRITSDTKLGVIIRNNTNWEHVNKYADVKDIPIRDSKVKEALDFARSQEGKDYDWKGIFLSQFIPADIHDKEKWFCNEICGEVLKKAGVINIIRDTNEYNPGSFQEIF